MTGRPADPRRVDDPCVKQAEAAEARFVNSLSDLFHEDVPDGFILDVFRVMAHCPQHVFQVLTKRPERAREWFAKWADLHEDDQAPKLVRGPEATRAAHTSGRSRLFADMIERWGEPPQGAAWPTYDWMDGMRWWPVIFDNVWLGVSIENARFTWRADVLRQIPAAIRFISAEPLLGSLFEPTVHESPSGTGIITGRSPLDLTGIDWVIVGGESGPGARPMHPDWAREIRDACLTGKCGHGKLPAFFFKQVGEWLPYWPDAQPPFWTTHDGSLYDGHHLPVGLSEGHPIRNRSGETWWAPDPGDEVIYRRVGKKRAGRLLDGRTWDEMPAQAAFA